MIWGKSPRTEIAKVSNKIYILCSFQYFRKVLCIERPNVSQNTSKSSSKQICTCLQPHCVFTCVISPYKSSFPGFTRKQKSCITMHSSWNVNPYSGVQN